MFAGLIEAFRRQRESLPAGVTEERVIELTQNPEVVALARAIANGSGQCREVHYMDPGVQIAVGRLREKH